jgi:predicted component of type VI protein secretion system
MIISMQDFQKEESLKGVSKTVETLTKLVEEYQSNPPTTLKQMKNAFHELKTAEEDINQVLSDDIEDEDLIARAKEATTKSSKVLRGMAAEMRFMAMKKPK